MKRNFRASLYSLGLVLVLASNNILSDPPQGDGDGGVVCQPPCDVFVCSGSFCTVCNADGCLTFRVSEQEN